MVSCQAVCRKMADRSPPTVIQLQSLEIEQTGTFGGNQFKETHLHRCRYDWLSFGTATRTVQSARTELNHCEQAAAAYFKLVIQYLYDSLFVIYIYMYVCTYVCNWARRRATWPTEVPLLRVRYSGTWRRVVWWKRTTVCQERTVCINRVAVSLLPTHQSARRHVAQHLSNVRHLNGQEGRTAVDKSADCRGNCVFQKRSHIA